MANIETMSVKFVHYSNSRPPSEVIVQISSSKLIESSVNESHFALTVSLGSPKCVGQLDSPLRKLHRTEKKQNVFGTLKGADSSRIRQNLFLVPRLAPKLESLRENGPAWTVLQS